MIDQDAGPPTFSVDIASSDGASAVSFAGELDISIAEAMRRTLLNPMVANATSVRVDLTEATFLDSSALGVIVIACRRARDVGAPFSVVVGDGIVRRIIAVSGLIDYLQVELP